MGLKILEGQAVVDRGLAVEAKVSERNVSR